MTRTMIIKKILAVSLAVSLLTTCLAGCSQSVDGVNLPSTQPDINTEEIVEKVVESIQEDIDNDTNEDAPPIDEIARVAGSLKMSDEWEDYVGDPESFVYGLIANELGYSYDVFSSYVDLPDGTEVYGFGYTDYDSCYVEDDEDGNEGKYISVFESGFIPFAGESSIPQDAFDDGLIIHNMEYENNDTVFVLSYESSPFKKHCVVYDQYLKYGVNEDGNIEYDVSPYEKGKCDEQLGSLYSFDEQKYVFDTDIGDSILLHGESLSSQIDYDEIENEINRVLETQDVNFANVDVESYAYESQEAIIAYFRNMQEESFLGYPVKDLIKIADNMDPRECIQINPDGIKTINLEEPPKEGEEPLVKWLVGTGCVILTAVGVAGSIVFVECPPLSAASGAISGAAIEIFMEVVISNEKLGDIKWSKVAIAAGTGAISGFLGPYVIASTSGASYFVVDSAIDGMLGAIEQTVTGFIDGERGIELAKKFGTGLVLGFALSGAFKGVAAAVGKAASKAGTAISKTGKSIAKTVKGKTSKASASGFKKLITKIGKQVGKAGKPLASLKKAAESSRFHSEYVSKKIAERIKLENANELITVSLNSLRKSDIVDKNGNELSKEAIKKMAKEAGDGDVLGYYVISGEKVEIKKLNSVVGIFFDKSKYPSVTLPDGIVADRATNFEAAAKLFKKEWQNNPDKIPVSIAKKIEESGISLDDMPARKLVDLIQNSDMVFHENIDLKTITLVARAIHDKANESGIGHFGGYGLAKHFKAYTAQKYFDRLVSALATYTVVIQGNGGAK